MKSLCLMKDQKFADYLGMVLEVGYDLEVDNFDQKEQELEELINSSYSFIFSDLGLEDKQVQSTFEYITTKKLDVLFIMLAVEKEPEEIEKEIESLEQSKLEYPFFDFISKDFKDADFFDFLEGCQERQKKQLANSSETQKTSKEPTEQAVFAQEAVDGDVEIVDEYSKIKSNRMLMFGDKLPFDLYLKLSDVKYVKIFNQGDNLEERDIKKYSKQDIGHFFFKKENTSLLMKKMKDVFEAISAINSPSKKNQVKKSILQSNIFFDRVKTLGFKQETIEEVNAINKQIYKTLKKEDRFKNIIERLMKNENYISQQATLISYISVSVYKKAGSSNDSILDKLSYAAFLHDCTFEEDHLAMIKTKEEIEEKNLSKKDKEFILSHPLKVSEIVKSLKTNVPNLDKIVLEHHEQPDGSGFPRGLSATKISPLGCLFIMSEFFASNIYDSEIDKTFIDNMVKVYDEKFSRGNFKTYLEPFKSFIQSLKV